MATRYSKDKYACIKDLKNEPLAKLTSDSKKRKFGDENVDAAPSLTVDVANPSPTLSLEVTAITPPLTRLKGKSKIGMSVWDDLATTLGRAHNVITNDKLKGLSSIPSHELVSWHIHKLMQVSNSALLVLLLDFVLYTSVTFLFSFFLFTPLRSLGNRYALPQII